MLQNLMGFDGRIGRQSWWISMIILVVASIILYFILSAIMGTGFTAMMDPQKMLEPGFMESLMQKAGIQQLISIAILGYPVLSAMSKRLNDRDRPGWFKWLFLAPSVLGALLAALGMAYTTTDVGGVQMPSQTTLMMIVSLLTLAVGIWGLVEMGFLKGTDGPNQHGPDPVAG